MLEEDFSLGLGDSSCVIRVVCQRRGYAESRRVECFLGVMTAVKHVHENLNVSLRLLWGYEMSVSFQGKGEEDEP